MRKNSDRKQRHGLLGYLPMLLVIILCCASVMVGIGAKYIQKMDSGYKQADALYFYLTSDRLTPEGAAYSQLCHDIANTTIPVEIRNYKDELNYSEVDYEVTVSYRLSNEESYKTLETRKLAKNQASSEKFDISLGSIMEMSQVEGATSLDLYIKAQVTAPYAATLYGHFVVEQDHSSVVNFRVNDSAGSNIVTMYVTTHDSGGTVTVNPPEGCLADPTSNHLPEFSISGQAVTFTYQPNSEYTFVFFKTDPDTLYTENHFTFSFH